MSHKFTEEIKVPDIEIVALPGADGVTCSHDQMSIRKHTTPTGQKMIYVTSKNGGTVFILTATACRSISLALFDATEGHDIPTKEEEKQVFKNGDLVHLMRAGHTSHYIGHFEDGCFRVCVSSKYKPRSKDYIWLYQGPAKNGYGPGEHHLSDVVMYKKARS